MSGSTENPTWPLPEFHYSVTGVPGTPVFQEVTGLETEVQTIQYRAGSNMSFAPLKLPRVAGAGTVTMKKGLFVTDNTVWDWFSAISMNTIRRSTIVVTLNDQTGTPQMTWTLTNAFPAKLTGTDLKSDGNEVAVESIEIAYETMTVATG